jgi:uncharacterized protein
MAEEIDDQLFKRLVLQNQYLILSYLDKEGSADWERASKIIAQHWPLDELPAIGNIQSYGGHPFTVEMRRELMDTLDLFEVLQGAEDRGLTQPDGGIVRTEFPGYSGNEESEFLSYYRDLTKQGERWPHLRRSNTSDFNSHFPMREAYLRLVAKWKELGTPRTLSQEQFERILSEWVHPENRKP